MRKWLFYIHVAAISFGMALIAGAALDSAGADWLAQLAVAPVILVAITWAAPRLARCVHHLDQGDPDE